MPMAASCRSTPARHWRCRASWRCGPSPTSPTFRRSISGSPASKDWRPTARPSWRGSACAMSASRSPPCSRPTPIWRRMPPTSSRSRSRSCRSFSTPAQRRASSRTAARPSRRSWKSPTATLPRRCATRMRWWSSTSRSGGIPACRWRPAAPSPATTPPTTCWKCTAPPRCRIGTATTSPACSGRDPSTVHLIEGHVGGGFGIRGELYPEDVLVCLAALRLGRPVKWIEDRREHLIAANHSRQQRHKVRAAVDDDGAHPRHRRRVLPRPGRLCAHPRGHRARPRGRDAAGTLSRAGLSGARACAAHQQDAGRHLSGARPVRKHVRARAPDGRDRGAARRSIGSRCGGATSLPKSEMPYTRPLATLGHRGRARLRRLCRAARQGAWPQSSWSELQERPAAPSRRRRMRRRGACDLRREERARAVRRRAAERRRLRPGRGGHRRGFGRAGGRDRGGADLRRCARRRLRARARHPRPHRPDRVRAGRVRIARDGDDRRGDAPGGSRGAQQGDRGGGRVAAAACRRARRRRRQGGAQGRRRRAVDDARRDRQGAGAGLEAARRRARRALRPTAGSTPIT